MSNICMYLLLEKLTNYGWRGKQYQICKTQNIET